MDILSVLLHQRSRNIGIIIPDVVISEKHSDTLEITEHPVEKPLDAGTSGEGAGYISEHAFRRPSEVVMETGFSGGGSLLDFAPLDTTAIGLSAGMSPRETYEKLLELQRKREPFSVTTGKRLYDNMLIKSLEVTTDAHSENVLFATITLREIIITQATETHVAAKENMKLGETTAPVKDMGTKTLKPSSMSGLDILNQLSGGGAAKVAGWLGVPVMSGAGK